MKRQFVSYDEFKPQVDESWWQATLRDEQLTANEEIFKTYRENSSATTTIDPQTTWQHITTAFEADDVVELPVISYNGGGLLVGWNAVRGFVPASHIVDFNPHSGPLERKRLFSKRVGTTMHLKVIECEPSEQRVVLSERAAQARAGTRDLVLRQLQPGVIVEGVVTNVTEFGAFVDLGGVEGLIHVSEISWSRVAHPSDILDTNQKVRTIVMNIIPREGRISLSIKRLHPDPWQMVLARYQVGQVTMGVVSHVVNFGAFVMLESGLEGLIHISELAEGNFMHPANVVQEGQTIQARIISLDPQQRRIGLSLRQLGTDAEADAPYRDDC